ncbi:MAG: hypothetical protein WAS27_01170 [Candidatus Saccharimonadales bacterium]
MWDIVFLPAYGNFSVRQIVRSFLAVIISAFLLTSVHSTTTFAATASWQDDGTIISDEVVFTQTSPVPSGIDAPTGATVFVANNEQQGTAKVLVIPEGADLTKEIQDAQIREYTVGQDGSYSNPRGPTTVTLAAKPAAKNKTQCDVAGVGWIICVTSRFIATGMDNIFTLIASYLEVKPVSTDRESGLYKAWSVALGIANLAFILAFLVIIYAQITSYGIDNYNIKKMIPKLIIAAVLVNISYYICSVAVDVSNILGHSVQQALIDIRKSLPDPAGGSAFTWKNLTEYILSGGTIVAGALAAKAAFLGGAAGGSISGLTFLLFPILVSGALAVLVALVVLAARQALITVLIVIAPLAFVAYLLPNTEKWFEKWRELFMTMLLVFPLFSLLFGGSQLASYIIIQNADQISIVIFAMFIQVAPLVMTPFLIKFSGSLLGRLSGMINDPKRGVVDRARGWATEKAEVQKAKGLEAAARPGGRSGTRFQRQAFKREKERLSRESWKKRGDAHVDAAWHHDPRYRDHHESTGRAELRKKAGESSAERHFETVRSTDRNLQRYVGRERANQDAIGALKQQEEARWEETRSEQMANDNPFARYTGEAQTAYRAQRIAQDNVTIAQALQKTEYSNAIQADVSLQARAGGIGGEQGSIKIKAAAVADVINSGNEAVKAINVASDIKAGDVDAMKLEFERAIDNNDIASMRAHADMLASSADVGMNTLRQTLKSKETIIRSHTDTLDTFRHHINSHQGINAQAEDIAVWSRDHNNGYRTIDQIGQSGDTWKNLTASQIAGSKKSTQALALNARKADGSWALTQGMATDIVRSTAWIGVKDEMKPAFLERAGISDRFDIPRG